MVFYIKLDNKIDEKSVSILKTIMLAAEKNSKKILDGKSKGPFFKYIIKRPNLHIKHAPIFDKFNIILLSRTKTETELLKFMTDVVSKLVEDSKEDYPDNKATYIHELSNLFTYAKIYDKLKRQIIFYGKNSHTMENFTKNLYGDTVGRKYQWDIKTADIANNYKMPLLIGGYNNTKDASYLMSAENSILVDFDNMVEWNSYSLHNNFPTFKEYNIKVNIMPVYIKNGPNQLREHIYRHLLNDQIISQYEDIYLTKLYIFIDTKKLKLKRRDESWSSTKALKYIIKGEPDFDYEKQEKEHLKKSQGRLDICFISGLVLCDDALVVNVNNHHVLVSPLMACITKDSKIVSELSLLSRQIIEKKMQNIKERTYINRNLNALIDEMNVSIDEKNLVKCMWNYPITSVNDIDVIFSDDKKIYIGISNMNINDLKKYWDIDADNLYLFAI